MLGVCIKFVRRLYGVGIIPFQADRTGVWCVSVCCDNKTCVVIGSCVLCNALCTC